MFVVHEGEERCSSFGFAGWENDSFENKEDAAIYMLMYAYPITKEQAIAWQFDVEVGRSYNMSMDTTIPVWMSVRLVDD